MASKAPSASCSIPTSSTLAANSSTLAWVRRRARALSCAGGLLNVAKYAAVRKEQLEISKQVVSFEEMAN